MRRREKERVYLPSIHNIANAYELLRIIGIGVSVFVTDVDIDRELERRGDGCRQHRRVPRSANTEGSQTATSRLALGGNEGPYHSYLLIYLFTS